MERINIWKVHGDWRTLAGYFYPERGTRYAEATEWDGNNHISMATGSPHDHEELYRTAQGRWVLGRYSNRQGELNSYQFGSPERAREWLLANEHDEAVKEHFGELEEERGPGRPGIDDGRPGTKIQVALPAELLAKLDARSADEDVTRAEMVRRLVAAGLD